MKIESIFSLVKTIRTLRAERGIKPGDLREVYIMTPSIELDNLEKNKELLSGLAKISALHIGDKPENALEFAYGVSESYEIYIDARIDDEKMEEEKNRLSLQIEDKKAYLRTIESKLAAPSFAKNAPEKIVRAEMEKRNETIAQLEKLEAKYKSLG